MLKQGMGTEVRNTHGEAEIEVLFVAASWQRGAFASVFEIDPRHCRCQPVRKAFPRGLAQKEETPGECSNAENDPRIWRRWTGRATMILSLEVLGEALDRTRDA